MSRQNLHIRIEVDSKNLTYLLSILNQSKRPLILTRKGEGIAAIIPYVDPGTIQDNIRYKYYESKN